MSSAITRALVREVFNTRHLRKWSLQGFGMLRTYLDGNIRLHVWDKRYAVPKVSLIHDHPWDFESLVVVGLVRNQRYSVAETIDPSHAHMQIRPGVGTERLSAVDYVNLHRHPSETYLPGDIYKQRAHEIHSSHPVDGTITIADRRRVGVDVANVYWPMGEDWVSGEPRDATDDERDDIIDRSLREWF